MLFKPVSEIWDGHAPGGAVMLLRDAVDECLQASTSCIFTARLVHEPLDFGEALDIIIIDLHAAEAPHQLLDVHTAA